MQQEILFMPRADDIDSAGIAASYQWVEEVPLDDGGWSQIEGGP